ncbi:xanthine dehydrogenase family protein molybdopterin-binding subunit [Haliea sp. E17]|uniref:xanthine dehydrogenase family protein molybdopterin-binding subunit n=1 Tax=Haliea sp. E17 TaxID=3401576 RepID=UPI003AABE504
MNDLSNPPANELEKIPEAEQPAQKDAKPGITTGRYIGQRVRRKEDPRLLTGHGQYVDDISVPGMLYAAFARSPVARGRIVAMDLQTAREVPGVAAVLTQDDLARFNVRMLSFYLTPQDVRTTPLADGRVAYAGEPVALVIAESRAIAEDAASLVEVEYAEETPVVSIADARSGAPVHPDMDDNLNAEMGDEDIEDELASALENAAFHISHSVVHQRISQSPMETRGVVACPEGAEELTLYITCQSPHMVARWVSMALGLPQTAVRVIAKDVGGGFGLKNHPWKEEVSVILAALALRRPVKWIEDRYENLTGANQAREQEMTLDIGFDAEGRLLGSYGDYSCNVGAFPQLSECNIAVHMFVWGAYKMPRYGFITRGWYSNTVGYAAYRGPWAMESLVRETALDAAARKMGIDPVELRRRNLVRLEDQPLTTCMGIPLEDVTPAECLDKLLDYFDVDDFRREQAQAREQGRYLGLGITAYIEPTGAAGAIATMTGELAQVRIEPTGQVTATLSTHSQGHGTATTMAQIIADRLGVDYENVAIYEGDSSRGGFSPGAAGSRQGVIAGGAAILASDMLAEKVKTLAAHLLDAAVDTISIERGVVYAAGSEQSMSLGELANIAYGEPDRLPPGFESGLEVQHRYQPPPMTFASAANACVVEVDPDTGFVSILRWISAEDCGTPINPAVVEGQVSGGLAQAIGMALLEKVDFDTQGNIVTPTYKDYHLPAISDVPEFEFVHCNTPSQSVGGMRGVGEGGAIIGTPTLVNAIADAISPFGEIAVDLPLTPPKILSVIEGRDLTAHAAPAPVVAAPAAVVADPAPAAAPEPEPEAADSASVVVDGDWDMVLASPVGPQPMVGHFETDGSALSGYLKAAEGQQPFSGGTVEGNSVKFDLKVEKPMKLTLKYDLVVEGDTISGRVKMGIFGKAKVTGQRSQG